MNTHAHGVPRLAGIDLSFVRFKGSADLGSLEVNRHLKFCLLLVYSHMLQFYFFYQFSQVSVTMFPLNDSR